MDEHAARDILAARAIETDDRERALWSDAERDAASLDAARAVGAAAGSETFLAQRAALVLERAQVRHGALVRTLRALAWPRWLAPVVLLAAFVAGVGVDRIGAAGFINILAPPVLGLLAWNLGIYVLLLVRRLTQRRPKSARADGPLRGALMALALRARAAPRVRGAAAAPRIVRGFARAWSALAAPLYATRAARILHAAAALLAIGVVAGLYLRGLAFEYRATWESTFLTPAQVHGLLAAVLAPGERITGIVVPGAQHLASIRTGGDPGSENAAPWLHLYAATLLLVVIVPRLALALVDGMVERRRARLLVVPIDEPYFRRLLRAFRDGPQRIRVVPYAFTLPPGGDEALRRVLRRAFGEHSEIAVGPGVAYGDEDRLLPDAVGADATLAIALFNAASTPEAATHGAFMTALARPGRDLVALIDESALAARWPKEHLEERRSAWRGALGVEGAAAFVNFAQPDLSAAEAALQAATAGRD